MLAFSCVGQKLDASDENFLFLSTKVKKTQYNIEQKLKISMIMKYTLYQREPQIRRKIKHQPQPGITLSYGIFYFIIETKHFSSLFVQNLIQSYSIILIKFGNHLVG